MVKHEDKVWRQLEENRKAQVARDKKELDSPALGLLYFLQRESTFISQSIMRQSGNDTEQTKNKPL